MQILVTHFPGFAALADARLAQAEVAKAERRRAAAAAAAAAGGGAAGGGGESGVGGDVGADDGADEGRPVAGAGAPSTSKRSRPHRRLVDLDSEEEAAEADDLLNLNRYKDTDLSHLLPETVGPLKVSS